MILFSQEGSVDIMDNVCFTNEEAREYIALLFDGYEKRKKDKTLYQHYNVPKIIIKTYYTYVKKPSFERLVYNFKRRYLYNENKVEQVHSVEEQKGLSCVYDYVENKTDYENTSIYDLSYIHEELYSKTPYPEFGGKYRNQDLYLLGGKTKLITGDVELCPYWNITHEMNLLRDEVDELVKRGIALGKKSEPDKIIEFINDCVMLKCKLIKIHPFRDGNGRSVRAFINLLFKFANIPPIYIENKEKFKYQEAMRNALIDENYTDILDFYYFKICDSIMALDLAVKNDITYKDANEHPTKVK